MVGACPEGRLKSTGNIADGHTASNAPDLFRPPKLSGAGPGQYWGGGPPGKTLGCCQPFLLKNRCLVRWASGGGASAGSAPRCFLRMQLFQAGPKQTGSSRPRPGQGGAPLLSSGVVAGNRGLPIYRQVWSASTLPDPLGQGGAPLLSSGVVAGNRGLPIYRQVWARLVQAQPKQAPAPSLF